MSDISSSEVVQDFSDLLSLSFRKNQCERPRFIRKTQQWVRCQSSDYSVCQKCASIRSLDKKRLIGSGCNASELDGITHEKLAPFRFFFATFTAPSFGKIRDSVPVDSRRYEYRRQVEWNFNSSALFHATMIRFERRLPDSQWCFVREWQKRGAIHFHGIIRVPKCIDSRAAWEEIRALRQADSKGISWGRQMDVQGIGDEAENSVRYMSKVVAYTAKHQGNRGMLAPTVSEFYARLDKHARNLVCRRNGCITNKSCDGRVHRNHGYAGQMLSMSKRWSFAELTFDKLNAQRAAFASNGKDEIQQAELAEAARLSSSDYVNAFADIDEAKVVAGKERLQAIVEASLKRDEATTMENIEAA